MHIVYFTDGRKLSLKDGIGRSEALLYGVADKAVSFARQLGRVKIIGPVSHLNIRVTVTPQNKNHVPARAWNTLCPP